MGAFRYFGRTPWTGDRPIARPIPTQESTTEKRGHTSEPQAGFEPTITVFERSETIPLGHIIILGHACVLVAGSDPVSVLQCQERQTATACQS
jgi:hypothetical protein